MAQSQMMEAVDIQGDFQVSDFLWNLLEQMCHRIRGFLEVEAQFEASHEPAAPTFMGIEVGQNMVKASSSVMFPEPHLQPYRPIPILIFFAKRISLASSQQDS